MHVRRDTLALSAPELVAETPDPSFLALTPDRRTLLAVNELTTFAGSASGALSAFSRDTVTNALVPLTPMRASRGAAPCYVSVDRTGQFALVANYVGGNVGVFPLGANGAPAEASIVVAHPGRGPHPRRQTSAHAHCILPDGTNQFVLSADLGTDRIYVSHFDARTGALTPADVPEFQLAAGAGPRHLAFSPDGRTLYCVNELNSTLIALAYDATRGSLTEQQVVSTRPEGATGENSPADLHVHPDGRTVYLSNRGDNTIAVFTVHPTTQRLTLVQSIPTGGDWPRNFSLTPDASGLLVAHQRSDTITAFRIDQSGGTLLETGQRQSVPVPVCLLFP
jgi:6-phosphogluconolactonase